MSSKRGSSSGCYFRVMLLAIVVGLSLFVWFRYGSHESGLPLEPQVLKGNYELLENPKWVESRANDGDSFLIRYRGGETTFRLYFVDAPETSQRFGSRVGYQARYFGISEKDAVAVGNEASHYVRDLMRRGAFEVLTTWESVYDSDRKFAMIRFSSRPHYLSERLIENGLARIYTKPTDLADGTSKWEFRDRLYKLERAAVNDKVGAWKRSNGKGEWKKKNR